MVDSSDSTVLISGDAVGLRRWTEAAGTTGDPHTRPYETVGTVLDGRLEVHVGGDVTTCTAGDSYRVPADAQHHYVVLEDLVAIEATSPPAS